MTQITFPPSLELKSLRRVVWAFSSKSSSWLDDLKLYLGLVEMNKRAPNDTIVHRYWTKPQIGAKLSSRFVR